MVEQRMCLSTHHMGNLAQKDSSTLAMLLESLLECLNQQRQGRSVSSEEIHAPQILLDIYHNETRYILTKHEQQSGPLYNTLSRREKEIARLISCGQTNKSIAVLLHISTWTVATHLRRIFAKLDVSSRAEMVARLLMNDLIDVN